MLVFPLSLMSVFERSFDYGLRNHFDLVSNNLKEKLEFYPED